MLKALKVSTDKTITEVDIDVPEDQRLALFQKAVGGYIEGVDFPHIESRAYANEDGIAERLPLNVVASILFESSWNVTQFIFGDIIIFGDYDDEGNPLPISEDAERVVRGIASAPDFLIAMYGYPEA